MFVLDSKLQADSFFVADLKMSRLLLMNDANYTWLILVPQKPDLVELTDLTFYEQVEVLGEINMLARILKTNFGCEKLNIGALGNVVNQLHIHVIARKKNDATFPKPVWGNAPAKPYEKDEAQDVINKIKSLI
jgi:diadenosine tetraphosphate (Ap4A) HIT family hydrolase